VAEIFPDCDIGTILQRDEMQAADIAYVAAYEYSVSN
jgi:hypothetical protein